MPPGDFRTLRSCGTVIALCGENMPVIPTMALNQWLVKQRPTSIVTHGHLAVSNVPPSSISLSSSFGMYPLKRNLRVRAIEDRV